MWRMLATNRSRNIEGIGVVNRKEHMCYRELEQLTNSSSWVAFAAVMHARDLCLLV